jgi:hypothetical protein
METLVLSLPPKELNRLGFRPYERFRPGVLDGARGSGAKGKLHLERIHGAVV